MSIKTHILLCCCSILFASNLLADNIPYRADAIPNDLTKDAYAVMRDHSAEFIQTSPTNAKYKVKEVITILDKKGEEFANFTIYCDKFRELDSFSGIIYDATGKVVKKIKKGDLVTSSISDDALASDSYTMFYNCKYPTYPFTVEYSYQEKWKDGIIAYPFVSPYLNYHFSVEKYSYRLETPDNIEVRINKKADFEIVSKNIQNGKEYTIKAEGLKAIPYEVYTPSFRETFPLIYMAPADFCYDSFCGNMSDWKNYGLWVNELLKGRDILPANVVAELQEITKDAENDREKVQIVYEHLQKNSRYVSIQLGIGGYRPIDAARTYKTGFGDCKGLTNLMKAMLKAIGIPSNYCVISMKEDKLFEDYPNFNQADHVILMVPLDNDNIWLECTSQTLPFGFVHEDIAGHDALVISDEGGVIRQLPYFTNEQNLTESKLIIDIAKDGKAKGKMMFTEHLHNYARVKYLLNSNDREKVVRYVNGSLSLPKIQIGEYEVDENNTSEPSISLNGSFEAPDFANVTGTRLFIPICPLKKQIYSAFSATSRNLPIDIEQGYAEADTIVFNIPEGYKIESLPKTIELSSTIGSLKTNIEVAENNSIVYTQYITINKGKYPNSDYKEIKVFFNQIASATKGKIVINPNSK